MVYLNRLVAAWLLGVFVGTVSPAAFAWELSGTHDVLLHLRDGSELPIGTVSFKPQGERFGFALQMDDKRFKDFFLSMKEFKCLEGSEEILCHVRYPYANPATVTAADLAWLEHALLFFYKRPTEFGAKLWNGVYYRMQLGPGGIVGTPQAIDLGLIASPPANPAIPPYGPDERSEMPAGSRWAERLIIR